jgi:hypothetical protein
MFKKIIIGILLLTVFGAAGAALAYNAANPTEQTEADTLPVLASDRNAATDDQVSQDVQDAQNPQDARDSQAQSDEAANAAAESMGEPWHASGTISALDDYGFDLTVADAEPVYIELGPPDYWQSQGIPLEVGQEVMVTGSINADMIHASQVLTEDGQVLEIRTESGQPLWSGGVGNGQSGEQGNGSQIPMDEWITIEGTLLSFQGGNMTMGAVDGALITFQTGQPRFFASQGVTFQVGDEIEVLGYYEGDQFMAGDIIQVATGLRVMLRDPNGRPLWSGPGNSNGNEGGQGGQGNGNQGNGNGHQYGRGGE